MCERLQMLKNGMRLCIEPCPRAYILWSRGNGHGYLGSMPILEGPLSPLGLGAGQGWCLPGFFPEVLIIRSVSTFLLVPQQHLVSSASLLTVRYDRAICCQAVNSLVLSQAALADASSSQPSTIAQGHAFRPWRYK